MGSRDRHGLALQLRRVHRQPARACGLLEAVTERQQLGFAEGRTQERQSHRQIVARESRRHDQIGEAREVGDVGGDLAARRRDLGRRRDERGPARRCRIDDSVELLRREDASTTARTIGRA